MRLGKLLIRSLEEFLRTVRDGKPVKQTIVRRMTVKGKTVYTHETFHAPLRADNLPNPQPRSPGDDPDDFDIRMPPLESRSRPVSGVTRTMAPPIVIEDNDV